MVTWWNRDCGKGIYIYIYIHGTGLKFPTKLILSFVDSQVGFGQAVESNVAEKVRRACGWV